MGAINFPIIPYKKKVLPASADQVGNELPFDPIPFTDAATTEKNLQSIGSQPFVSVAPKIPFTPIPLKATGAARSSSGLPFTPMATTQQAPKELPINLFPNERAIVERNIAIPDRPAPKQVERGGILGTLGSIGRGALLGLSLEGGKGLGQGLGGALVGGIGGAISPQSVENLHFDKIVLPRYEQEKANALKEIGFQQEIIGDIAKRTGIDPRTGKPTPEEAYRQAQLRNITDDNKRQDEAAKDKKLREDAEAKVKADTETYKRSQDLINNRQQITKEGGTRLTMADLFTPRKGENNNTGEIIQIGDKDVYRLPSAEQVQARKLEEAKAKGEADLTLDLKKDALMTPRKLDLIEETERIRQKYDPPKESPEDKERRATIERARGESRRVQSLIDRARTLDHQSRDLVDDAKRDKEQEAKAAWDAAEIAATGASAQYPEYIKGGLGDGGYAFVEFQEPKGAAASSSKSASGTLSKQSGNYKAGDVVRYKGQRHRILRFENGNPVLDPNPIQ